MHDICFCRLPYRRHSHFTRTLQGTYAKCGAQLAREHQTAGPDAPPLRMQKQPSSSSAASLPCARAAAAAVPVHQAGEPLVQKLPSSWNVARVAPVPLLIAHHAEEVEVRVPAPATACTHKLASPCSISENWPFGDTSAPAPPGTMLCPASSALGLGVGAGVGGGGVGGGVGGVGTGVGGGVGSAPTRPAADVSICAKPVRRTG